MTREFLPWLNRVTGRRFRLPSEAEWEYAARGGTTTKYYLGNNQYHVDRYKYENCTQCGETFYKSGVKKVKSYQPNPFGLYDMLSNATELVEDYKNDLYDGGPLDSAPWKSGDSSRRRLTSKQNNKGAQFGPPFVSNIPEVIQKVFKRLLKNFKETELQYPFIEAVNLHITQHIR